VFNDFPEDPGGQHPGIFTKADKDEAIQEFLSFLEEEEIVSWRHRKPTPNPSQEGNFSRDASFGYAQDRGVPRVFTLEVFEEMQTCLCVFGVEAFGNVLFLFLASSVEFINQTFALFGYQILTRKQVIKAFKFRVIREIGYPEGFMFHG
jgi:hypothetical protein